MHFLRDDISIYNLQGELCSSPLLKIDKVLPCLLGGLWYSIQQGVCHLSTNSSESSFYIRNNFLRYFNRHVVSGEGGQCLVLRWTVCLLKDNIMTTCDFPLRVILCTYSAIQPFYNCICLAKSLIIFMLTLMPIVSIFWRLIFCPKKSFEGFYHLDHVFLWKRHLTNK